MMDFDWNSNFETLNVPETLLQDRNLDTFTISPPKAPLRVLRHLNFLKEHFRKRQILTEVFLVP